MKRLVSNKDELLERLRVIAARQGVTIAADLPAPVRPRPRCPVCDVPDLVEPNRTEVNAWLCAGCWTVFTGQQDEYRANAERRKRLGKAEPMEDVA